MSDTTKQQGYQVGDTALCRGRGYGPAVVRVVEAKLVDSRVAYTVQSVNNPASTWLTSEAQLEAYQPSSRSPQSGRKARRGQNQCRAASSR